MARTKAVCDASAIVSFLLSEERGAAVGAYLDGTDVHAPDLMLYEVGQVVRNHELQSVLSASDAVEVFGAAFELEIEYWTLHELAPRAWELRKNLSLYDAAYVALAELIEAPLITLDERLARAPGIRCEVIVP